VKDLVRWVLWASLSLSLHAQADSVRYAVTSESWEPYWIVRDNAVSGILSDVMQALQAHVNEPLLPDRPLPPLRAQKQFLQGKVSLECCVSMAWRASTEQAEVSLWSDTVLEAEEVLVFPAGRAFVFDQLQDLQGRTIATVRGYGYIGSEYFTRSDSPDSKSQLLRLAQGRAEAAIIDRLELAYLLREHPELSALAGRIEMGPVINRSALRIRVHRSREDLLVPLNAAIATVRRDGALAGIVERYTGER
jgi:polar amino acid transport system substrate-binding protein